MMDFALLYAPKHSWRDNNGLKLYSVWMLSFLQFPRQREPGLAIDLGTANMRIMTRGEGLVFDEPSLCYFQNQNGQPRFVTAGRAVGGMVDRVPKSFSVRRPLARGVLQDIEAASALLAHGFAAIARKGSRSRPFALIGIPADATKAEANALMVAACDAGLGRVELVRETMAAAVGADLPINEPRASMIVECGAGTTEIAVFSSDGVCKTKSVRAGGKSLDMALTELLQVKHHFLIGQITAETLKRNLSSRDPSSSTSDETLSIKGRDLHTGLPGTLTIEASVFDPVLRKHFAPFAEATRVVLSELSPDLAADLLNEGIVATGGGICAHFLAEAIARECDVPVTVADDPSGCVARGLERMMFA